jgi:hypothetical protein
LWGDRQWSFSLCNILWGDRQLSSSLCNILWGDRQWSSSFCNILWGDRQWSSSLCNILWGDRQWSSSLCNILWGDRQWSSSLRNISLVCRCCVSRFKYSPQNIVLKHLNICLQLKVGNCVSQPYKTTAKFILFFILVYRFSIRLEDKIFWTE